jgi:hypothetical protein
VIDDRRPLAQQRVEPAAQLVEIALRMALAFMLGLAARLITAAARQPGKPPWLHICEVVAITELAAAVELLIWASTTFSPPSTSTNLASMAASICLTRAASAAQSSVRIVGSTGGFTLPERTVPPSIWSNIFSMSIGSSAAPIWRAVDSSVSRIMPIIGRMPTIALAAAGSGCVCAEAGKINADATNKAEPTIKSANVAAVLKRSFMAAPCLAG